MNKIEALKACLEGNKIRCLEWPNQEAHIAWDGATFIHYAYGMCNNKAMEAISNKKFNNWEVLPDAVNWLTALAAYKGYKKVQSITGEIYSLNCEDETLCVTLSEIEGKWLILD